MSERIVVRKLPSLKTTKRIAAGLVLMSVCFANNAQPYQQEDFTSVQTRLIDDTNLASIMFPRFNPVSPGGGPTVDAVDRGPDANDVTKLCRSSPDHARTTSQDDPTIRQGAASAIMNQNVGVGAFARRAAAGQIFTVRFADGGTEQYRFETHVSLHTPIQGSLKEGTGVPNGKC